MRRFKSWEEVCALIAHWRLAICPAPNGTMARTSLWLSGMKFLEEADSEQSELEGVNRLVESYAGRAGLWRDYYSFDLIQSVESRRKWIEPDG